MPPISEAMLFAYADPPYLGNGKKRYAPFHNDASQYDSMQSHFDLIKRLTNEYENGWAMSLNPKDLVWALPACPPNVRVMAWTKTFYQIRVNVSTQYAWEPLLVFGGRNMKDRRPMTRDWLSCPIAMRKGLPGAKPDKFYQWLLDVLGWQPHDTVDDLFPGTNGLSNLIAKLSAGNDATN